MRLLDLNVLKTIFKIWSRSGSEEWSLSQKVSSSQLNTAYIAFTKGFISNFIFYVCTIESFEDYVNPIEEVNHDCLHPSLFGRAEPLHREFKGIITM